MIAPPTLIIELLVMNKFNGKGFSLIELSIVVLIIGILIAGVTQGSRLVRQSKIKTAQNLTTGSAVASIPDLGMWLEPVLDNSIVSATNGQNPENGDSVSSWNDYNPQSTVKVNVTQATSNNQPVYIAAGINNLPTLYFNGSTSAMSGSNGPISVGNKRYTLIAVIQTQSPTSGSWEHVIYQGDWCNGATQGAVASITLNPSGNTGPGYAGCMNDYYPNGYTLNKTSINISVVNNTSVKYYNNSNTAQSSTLSGPNLGPSSSTTSVGHVLNSQTFQGYISEIIVYNRNLKPSEVSSINEYLSKKYAIVLN